MNLSVNAEACFHLRVAVASDFADQMLDVSAMKELLEKRW